MPVSKRLSDLAFKCREDSSGLSLRLPRFYFGFEPARYAGGMLIAVFGQLLRYWAAGYIPKYRTEKIDAPILVTWGPYRWVRNPLYAGNFIMGLGWALMVGWIWVAAFTAAFLFLYCYIVIPAEEEFLAAKFGEQYLAYRESVPSLFPRPGKFMPDTSPYSRSFDRERAWSEEIYSIRMNILGRLISGRLYITIFCKNKSAARGLGFG